MKGFSSPIIEALAFFLALSFVVVAYGVYENSRENVYKAIKNCDGECYKGFIFLSKEELEGLNATVVGEGSYGVIYLNKDGKVVVRLR